jgi:hypothetical protein
VFVVYFVLLLRNWVTKKKKGQNVSGLQKGGGRMSEGQSCNTQHLHISIQKLPESGG